MIWVDLFLLSSVKKATGYFRDKCMVKEILLFHCKKEAELFSHCRVSLSVFVKLYFHLSNSLVFQM